MSLNYQNPLRKRNQKAKTRKGYHYSKILNLGNLDPEQLEQQVKRSSLKVSLENNQAMPETEKPHEDDSETEGSAESDFEEE